MKQDIGKNLWKALIISAALVLCVLGISPAQPAQANTCTVTSSLDDGSPGTLRALLADPSCDTINFHSDMTIHLATVLDIDNSVDTFPKPALALTIDGGGHQVTISGDTNDDGIGDTRLFKFYTGSWVVLNNLTFKNGYSGSSGGAILNSWATLDVNNSAFINNRSQASHHSGGAIANIGGSLTITNSTFAENSAPMGEGGAIVNGDPSNGYPSKVNVFNSTFYHNSAESGSAIFNMSEVEVYNTIFAKISGGSTYSDFGGSITGANNLVDDSSFGVSGFTQYSIEDMKLGTLSDQGGSTQIIPLLPGSPAIDAGANCPATDQRDVDRPQGEYCDIGSYERVERSTFPAPSLAGFPLYKALIEYRTPGAITTCMVDFGDGTDLQAGSIELKNSNGTYACRNYSHIYSTPGTYLITFYLTDAQGKEVRDTLEHTVIADPDPGYFTWIPDPVVENGQATFTATATGYDMYEWCFLSIPGFAGFWCVGSGQEAVIDFGSSGTYQIMLMMINVDEVTGEWSSYITDGAFVSVVVPPPPQLSGPYANLPGGGSAEPSYAGQEIVAITLAQGVQDSTTCTVNYGDGSGVMAGAIIHGWGWYCQGPAHTYAAAGDYTITVVVTNPNGQFATASTQHQVIAAPAPVPALTALSPASATTGTGDLILTVNGSDFVDGSLVRWNSAELITTFVNDTQLTATVPAGSLASVQTSQVTVFTPAPGGGTSDILAFFVTQSAANVTGQDVTSGTDPSATAGSSTAAATGDGLLVVAQYYANPGGTPSFAASGTYFDVYAAPGNSFTQVSIVACGMSASDRLFWWDTVLDKWVKASPQTFNPATGCITLVVDAHSSPSLTQLQGTFFGAGVELPQYQTAGFTAPVDLGGVLNLAKGGQMIPLKWRLLDGNGNPVTNLDPASVTMTVSSYTCQNGNPTDAIETYANGTTNLQNLGDGYYQLNWKTLTDYANSCRQITLKIGGWTVDVLTALFQFKK